MRVVLVGVVNSAEQALLGLLEQKADICAIFTNDIKKIMAQSQMGAEYYCDFTTYSKSIGCPIYSVENLNEHIEDIKKLKPDIVVAMGWPYMIGKEITESFLCIGMHPTKLPERRGGAPLNWQIIDGVTDSAVSIIKLEDGVDSGDILVQKPFQIMEQDYISDIMRKVCLLTKEAVSEAYFKLNTGIPEWIKQDSQLATYTRRRKPEDGIINWNDSSIRVYNLIRAISHPFPGAYTFLGDEVLKVWKAHIPMGYRAKVSALPGELLSFDGRQMIVSTRDNAISISIAEYNGKVYEGKALEEIVKRIKEVGKLGGNTV